MQRSLILIASLTTALALAGCGQSDEPQTGSGGQPAIDETAPASPDLSDQDAVVDEVVEDDAVEEEAIVEEDVLEEETADTEAVGPLTVDGSVTYRERMALPEEAQLTVQLLDVSLADAAAETLAEVSFVPTHQVPIDFSLEYDADAVADGHSYAVRADIRDGGGQLLWTTTDHHGVELGPDAEQEAVEIVLQRVAAEPEDEDATAGDTDSAGDDDTAA